MRLSGVTQSDGCLGQMKMEWRVTIHSFMVFICGEHLRVKHHTPLKMKYFMTAGHSLRSFLLAATLLTKKWQHLHAVCFEIGGTEETLSALGEKQLFQVCS